MNLEAWFDALTVGKVEAMKGSPESQALDCKRVGSPRDFQKNLAIVVAGFANADGGVCLWGIDARKNSEGIDCIDGFPGVDDPPSLAARLDELTPQAASPGVVGVVHRALVQEGHPGFVATFVPSSASGPHMSRYQEDRYYQRIGQSFLRMEPFQIADAFGRRPQPLLAVRAEPVAGARNGRVVVSLTNLGRGIARAPYFRWRVETPYRSESSADPRPRGIVVDVHVDVPEQGWLAYIGSMQAVLHPGLSIEMPEQHIQLFADKRDEYRSGFPDFKMECRFGAIGVAETRKKVISAWTKP